MWDDYDPSIYEEDDLETYNRNEALDYLYEDDLWDSDPRADDEAQDDHEIDACQVENFFVVN